MLTLTTTKSATISTELLAIAKELGAFESAGFNPEMSVEDRNKLIENVGVQQKINIAEAYASIDKEVDLAAAYYAVESQTAYVVDDAEHSMIVCKMRTVKTLQGIIAAIEGMEIEVTNPSEGIYKSAIWNINMQSRELTFIVPTTTLDYVLAVTEVGHKVAMEVYNDFPEHQAAINTWLEV